MFTVHAQSICAFCYDSQPHMLAQLQWHLYIQCLSGIEYKPGRLSGQKPMAVSFCLTRQLLTFFLINNSTFNINLCNRASFRRDWSELSFNWAQLSCQTIVPRLSGLRPKMPYQVSPSVLQTSERDGHNNPQSAGEGKQFVEDLQSR